jgi:hypothetical protein
MIVILYYIVYMKSLPNLFAKSISICVAYNILCIAVFRIHSVMINDMIGH